MKNESDSTASSRIGAGRIFCIVEYDGAGYRGWQIQNNGVPSVQGALEYGLSKVANVPVSTTCAGRTDAAVHGTAQVVHFDCPVVRDQRAWLLGVNTNLPDDVRLLHIDNAASDFHARFSATARRYRYVIYNHSLRPSLMRNLVTWQFRPLDADRMHAAAQSLIGELDFSSFRAVGCQSKTPFRNVHFINVTRYHRYVVIDIQANAFLHHMVRNIAGVLMEIGCGKKPVNWCGEVLALKDRTRGGVTAPPEGLYLVNVQYPEAFAIPDLGLGPEFLQQPE
ncbi:MAG: tRNA pseudouridine(38-40) synthase TruA [Pseudomonadales bacterium]|nr:tRNA pseudouridine(38-40) synthase TruA [Pseudomonadales bacterium]